MPRSPPDQFLQDSTTATINTSGAWQSIRIKENIVVNEATTLRDQDHPNAENDVWVTLPASYYALDFSSERNLAYFGPLPPNVSRGNNASTGDSLGSAVLLLRPQKNPGTLTLGQVYTSFDIDLNDGSLIASFLNKIDGADLLSVTLPSGPGWNPEPKTGLMSTIRSQLPTNALWFTTTEDAYFIHLQLSFTLTSDVLDNALSWITSNFDNLKPKSIDKRSLTLTLKRQSRYAVFDPTNEQTTLRCTQLAVAFEMLNFHVNIDITRSKRSLLLTPTNDGTISTVITTAFDSIIGDVENFLPDASEDDFFNTVFDNVHLWYVSLEDDELQPKGEQLSWGVGLLAIWKPKHDNIVIALTYNSKSSTFIGKLLTAADLPGPLDIRHPSWDPRVRHPSWDPRVSSDDNLSIAKMDPSALQGIDLFDLVGLEGAQPPIPHILSAARVSFAKTGNGGSAFNFLAVVTRERPGDSTGEGAPSPFTWDEASVDVTIHSTKTGQVRNTTYSIDVFSSFSLNPPPLPADHEPILSASFAIALHCDKSEENGTTWILRGGARNLSIGLLRSFFDKDSQDGAMAVMDKLNLQSLDVIYTYNGAIASSFLITGVITLGDLELDLGYQYVSEKATGATATQVYLDDAKDDDGAKAKIPEKDRYTIATGERQWNFSARLSATSPRSTVASIAESIKKGAGDSLPSWVGDIEVNPEDDGQPIAEIKLSSQPTDDETLSGNSSVFTAFLNIAGFTLTFVQYQPAAKKAVTGGAKQPVKRLLRIAVDQIPTMKDVPLVGKLPQPFDSLEYVWVEDDNPVVGNIANGITSAELDDITDQMPDDIPPFQVKDDNPVVGSIANGITPADLDDITDQMPDDIPLFQVKDASKSDESPKMALAAGHHFLVLAHGTVVLDHVFHADRASTEKDETPTNSDATDSSGNTPISTASDSGIPDSAGALAKKTTFEAPATKGHSQVRAGPLSVSAISLQFKNNSLFVSLDATLQLGPLTFTVIGFTIEIMLSGIKSLSDLASIVRDGLVKASLHGIEVGVQQGPLTLKGVFIHDVVGDTEKYSGGIAVGFTAWQILAIGQYTIKHADKDGKGGLRAVFVYGKLDGPLITIEFAQISGVRVGFGYNYAVRSPSVKELSSFPFISDTASANSGNDPMKVLDAMVGSEKPFVYVKEKASWFCAGMTITAFDLLALTAVLMVNIDQSSGPDNGVTIALLADGIFQMDPKVHPDLSLFYIEVVLSVEFNFAHGYIAANAVLAPASHVYIPQAMLTGGASFTTWFGVHPNAGDWVMTIGGYSRTYQKPDHYPRPQPVGLNFIVGDNIHIVGVGYLAVTPKVAMAGGSLHMSLSVGPVSAYADIMLDAFINFKPFHFRAFMSVSVGVECDIDILFIHIHISIHLGADLTLWGPNDFGGRAHVDFWFFGFDIDFGASENNISESISLREFWHMLQSPGPSSTPPTNDLIGKDSLKTLHKYSVEEGLVPASITPNADGANKTTFPSTGATKEFQVQAGTLKLRIDCDFPLSAAFLHRRPLSTGNPAADLDEGIEVTFPMAPNSSAPPPTPLLYSKPMHNNSSKDAITSKLDVWVYKDEGLDGTTKQRIKFLQNSFRAELILKSAAKALWGEYNSTDDPLDPNNARPTALQTGASPTTDLVQAIRILPPHPQLYPDPKIEAQTKIIDFDATAAMRFPLDDPPSTVLRDSIANAVKDASREMHFAGAYFESDVKDSDEDAQIERWKAFGALWNPSINAAASVPGTGSDTTTNTDGAKEISLDQLRKGIVTGIASELEWNIPSPEQKLGARSTVGLGAPGTRTLPRINIDGRWDWELVDGQPRRLVDELATYYPALPFIVASTA